MRYLKYAGICWVILELLLFVLVAKVIGVLSAILLIILSMIIGGGLMRSEGYRLLQEARQDMIDGKSPEKRLRESLSVALGGFLMIIPGFITSIIGIFFIIPGIRKCILDSFLSLRFKRPQEESHDDEDIRHSANQGRTIDGEFKKD